VDEAQTLTPHEIKPLSLELETIRRSYLPETFSEFDTPYLDSHSNDVFFELTGAKDHPLYAHIKLEKRERSELASGK